MDLAKCIHVSKRFAKQLLGEQISDSIANVKRSVFQTVPYTINFEPLHYQEQNEKAYKHVRGWIISPYDISHPIFSDSSGLIKTPLNLLEKGEIQKDNKDKNVVRFEGYGFTIDPSAKAPYFIEFSVGGETFQEVVEVSSTSSYSKHCINTKKKKLDKIRPILCCPTCQSLIQGEDKLCCSSCNQKIRIDPVYSQVSFVENGGVEINGSFATTYYDKKSIELIELYRDGLILEIGSGARQQCFENVVCLDIEGSPMVDVQADAHRLPFQDNSFDVVLSHSTLEHLQSPQKVVKELFRVLKPRGLAYVVAPMLAPFHGYPSHYFNMTQVALEDMFSRFGTTIELKVYPHGGPCSTLSWILRSWIAGLPFEQAQQFKNMKVKDLLFDTNVLENCDFVKKLTASATTELACANYIVSQKPSA